MSGGMEDDDDRPSHWYECAHRSVHIIMIRDEVEVKNLNSHLKDIVIYLRHVLR